MKKQKVLVGMSGGIDSTATCLMLQEQGYELVGLTMWVWGDEPIEARQLAERMGIEHHIVDEREAFKQTIVQNFIDEYRAGRTPNPCVLCNPMHKFAQLIRWADRLGCAQIATGHYSRLVEVDGITYIEAGDDAKKDQSYFLWKLGQDVLKRCIFPLGNYTKTQVRDYLRQRGYAVKADEGESMEVCFIKGDYRDFLREHSPEIDKEIGPGMFVNSEGVKLGEHKGYPYYTIGQRKGLGISLGERMFGLGTIHCCSGDKTSPEFDIKRIKCSREVKELLSDMIEEEREKRRVGAREFMDSDGDGYDDSSENEFH